jgi:hypothetical protein
MRSTCLCNGSAQGSAPGAYGAWSKHRSRLRLAHRTHNVAQCWMKWRIRAISRASMEGSIDDGNATESWRSTHRLFPSLPLWRTRSVHGQDGPRMSTAPQTAGVERSAEQGAATVSAATAGTPMSEEPHKEGTKRDVAWPRSLMPACIEKLRCGKVWRYCTGKRHQSLEFHNPDVACAQIYLSNFG